MQRIMTEIARESRYILLALITLSRCFFFNHKVYLLSTLESKEYKCSINKSRNNDTIKTKRYCTLLEQINCICSGTVVVFLIPFSFVGLYQFLTPIYSGKNMRIEVCTATTYHRIQARNWKKAMEILELWGKSYIVAQGDFVHFSTPCTWIIQKFHFIW